MIVACHRDWGCDEMASCFLGRKKKDDRPLDFSWVHHLFANPKENGYKLVTSVWKGTYHLCRYVSYKQGTHGDK